MKKCELLNLELCTYTTDSDDYNELYQRLISICDEIKVRSNNCYCIIPLLPQDVTGLYNMIFSSNYLLLHITQKLLLYIKTRVSITH